jgi:hypothetical protein
MQAKFRRFEAADAARFDELWRLQQEEAEALARKLLDASRVLHEQQLGWAWRAPDERVSGPSGWPARVVGPSGQGFLARRRGRRRSAPRPAARLYRLCSRRRTTRPL